MDRGWRVRGGQWCLFRVEPLLTVEGGSGPEGQNELDAKFFWALSVVVSVLVFLPACYLLHCSSPP